MSVAHWPEGLPKPLRSGYQLRREDNRRRRLAGGPIGYSRQFSSRVDTVTLALETNLDQRAVFWRFYDEDVRDGTLPFLMPDPTTDGQGMLSDLAEPITDETGAPLLLAAEWLCLFGEEVPTEALEAARYVITFSVVVLP